MKLAQSIQKLIFPILLGLFTVISSLYRYLPAVDPFIPFLTLYTLHFACYGLLLRYQKHSGLEVGALIGVALISRLLLLSSAPVLENDYFRYLWDGRVLAHGQNPYLYPPNSPELDSLNVWYRELIGWPEIRTIYPPLSEIFFGILHLIAPDSLLALKIVLIVFEILTGALLLLLTRNASARRSVALLYFFNPLLLKEIANSAHLDALPMLLSLAAIACFMTFRNFKWLGWMLIALAVGAKSYPILLVPLFVKLDPRWGRNLLIFSTMLFALYLPFLGAREALFTGATAFGTYWIFNAGLFKLITVSLNWSIEGLTGSWALSEESKFILMNDYPAKVFVGIALVSFVIYWAQRINSPHELPRASLSIFGVLLLLSPVVNAWYVLWLFPFACLERSKAWLSFTCLVVGAYAWFWSESYLPAIRTLEYTSLYLLLSWEWCRQSPQGGTRNSHLFVLI